MPVRFPPASSSAASSTRSCPNPSPHPLSLPSPMTSPRSPSLLPHPLFVPSRPRWADSDPACRWRGLADRALPTPPQAEGRVDNRRHDDALTVGTLAVRETARRPCIQSQDYGRAPCAPCAPSSMMPNPPCNLDDRRVLDRWVAIDVRCGVTPPLYRSLSVPLLRGDQRFPWIAWAAHHSLSLRQVDRLLPWPALIRVNARTGPQTLDSAFHKAKTSAETATRAILRRTTHSPLSPPPFRLSTSTRSFPPSDARPAPMARHSHYPFQDPAP
ncbi:hypothetical protein M2351_005372 [Azospirillum canadense]|nr:hypothetical protein [Azospirillum canadense]